MKSTVVLLCLLGVAATSAMADIPNPCCITSLDGTQRLLLIPDNDGADPSAFGAFTVTVRNYDCAPVQNAMVEVLVGGLATGKVKGCGGASWIQHTDAQGVAVFNIPGGGCAKGTDAVSIRANGVIIRAFQAVVSPDYAGWDNAGQSHNWSLSITAMDFAAFTRAMASGGSSCHDYDNSGTTGASDFSVFGQVWSGGQRACSP